MRKRSIIDDIVKSAETLKRKQQLQALDKQFRPSVRYINGCNEIATKMDNPLGRLALNVGTVFYANNWVLSGYALQALGIGIEIKS